MTGDSEVTQRVAPETEMPQRERLNLDLQNNEGGSGTEDEPVWPIEAPFDEIDRNAEVENAFRSGADQASFSRYMQRGRRQERCRRLTIYVGSGAGCVSLMSTAMALALHFWSSRFAQESDVATVAEPDSATTGCAVLAGITGFACVMAVILGTCHKWCIQREAIRSFVRRNAEERANGGENHLNQIRIISQAAADAAMVRNNRVQNNESQRVSPSSFRYSPTQGDDMRLQSVSSINALV